MTEYEYDETGRLVGSTSSREAEWSGEDREALIAYLETQRVGPHGYPMSEATSRDVDPANPERLFDLVVPMPTRDHMQAALNREQDTYRKKYPDADMGSLKWRIERRPR